MQLAQTISEVILGGFNKHYKLFQEITAQAKSRFEMADWPAVHRASSDRISFYDKRVSETIEALETRIDVSELDEQLWLQVKEYHLEQLRFHPQAELAETFYNSVFCRLFHRDYFNNSLIFVETTLASEIPVPKESVYLSLFPSVEGLRKSIKNMLLSFEFSIPFVDMDKDIEAILDAFRSQTDYGDYKAHQLRFDVLKSVFYRNKAAYLVGRVVSSDGTRPFIIPILNNENGQIYIDTILTEKDHVSVIFGFSRAYFMVEATAPSALVHFLRDLLPHKTLAELYSCIGFHKQGKTEFYRELLDHLDNSDDKFGVAPGIKGMVMEVFTLPSFPYVFKVIKDKFAPSKEFTRKTVKDRYFLVKKHDRVGRMADTLEYSDVALPRYRISDELFEQLQQTIPSSMEIENDKVIIKHLYIERRMIPLNMYLETANEEETEHVIKDYGKALKEMIAVNIFPGDMLLKNFGVTRHKRIVFYDYDEVQYLLDMNFRKIPKPRTFEDEFSAEPFYSVSPGDVFPEQILTFVTTQPKIKQLFLKHHSDLLEADYWKGKQAAVREGRYDDIFPYPRSLRFKLYDEEAVLA